LSTSPVIPCLPIAPLKIPKISLPMGIELQAIADMSKPPSNCALIHNLMLQLMPTLAGFNCIIKILNVIASLEGFLSALPNVINAAAKAGDVLAAIGDMKDCLNLVLGPIAVAETIKDILLLIISYLKCFVDAIKSILNFQVGIDLNAAQGNPVLLASLSCASNNAQVSMQQLLQALGPIKPLFKMVEPLIKISQLPIALPPIADLAGAKDVREAVNQLDAMLAQLQQIVGQIP
jgi:hypothetical protein